MNRSTSKLSILSAEFLKLRSTPVIYLILACCLLVTSMSVLASVMDVHHSIKLGESPWSRFTHGSLAVFSIFMISPMAVVIISALSYIEKRANSWKYIYTLPFGRGNIYFAKLFTILILMAVLCALMILIMVFSGYIVDFFYPEYEFRYFKPDVTAYFESLSHIFVGVLGIIGIQYLLTYIFQHFLIPLVIGFTGFIVGFIMSAANTKLAIYIPFVYPISVKDQRMFRFDYRTEAWEGSWINNLELYSIICFVTCVALGYLYEVRRNVK